MPHTPRDHDELYLAEASRRLDHLANLLATFERRRRTFSRADFARLAEEQRLAEAQLARLRFTDGQRWIDQVDEFDLTLSRLEAACRRFGSCPPVSGVSSLGDLNRPAT